MQINRLLSLGHCTVLEISSHQVILDNYKMVQTNIFL